MVNPLSHEPFAPPRPCCGWRDALLGTVMASTVVGTGALALFAKTLYALPFGGALVAVEGVIWFCWRKDAAVADMRRTTQQMGQTAGQLEEVSNRAAAVTEHLGATGEALHQDRVALEHESAVAAKEIEQLQQELGVVQKELDSLRGENRDLKINVSDLQKKLDQMKLIVQQFSGVLQDKGKLQKDLADKLKQGKENIADLAAVEHTFTVDMGHIDTSWDEDVQNFKEAIDSFNVQGKALLEQVTALFKRFSDQVEQAGLTEGRLKQDVEDLKRALEELRQVSQMVLPLQHSDPAIEGLEAIFQSNQHILEALRRGSHATHQPSAPSHTDGQ